MIIEITDNAKKILEESDVKNSKYLLIKMVKYDCHGAVLSMSVSTKQDDNQIFEQDGYKFIMNKEESEMFEKIKIDYKTEGLNEGFSVTHEGSLMGKCFINDEID